MICLILQKHLASWFLKTRGQTGMTPEIAERGVIRAFGRDNNTGEKIQTVTVITIEGSVVIPRK